MEKYRSKETAAMVRMDDAMVKLGTNMLSLQASVPETQRYRSKSTIKPMEKAVNKSCFCLKFAHFRWL